MFDTLFSFQGRLSRLLYVGCSLAALMLAILVIIVLLLCGAALAVMLPPSSAGLIIHNIGPFILGVLTAVATSVIVIWTSLSLTWRRVRDTGYDPLVVIGLCLGFCFVDAAILTRLTEVRFFWPFDQFTPLGGLVALGYLLFLLLWPSAPAADLLTE